MKKIMINLIRQYQYYEAGALENMTEEQVKEIYDIIIEWLG